MGLQKRINKRFIKKAIWSDYVYQIEAEEKSKSWYYYETDEERKSSKLKSFFQEWVNELKREMKKD